MSQHSSEQQHFPRGPVIATGILLAAALLLVSASKTAEVGTMRVSVEHSLVSRDLSFADRADGAVVVSSFPDGAEVTILAPGTNGFIRGVLRGLSRERMLSGMSYAEPFRLVRGAGGRLSLIDLATGREIELNSFGPTNVLAFAKLLTEGRAAK